MPADWSRSQPALLELFATCETATEVREAAAAAGLDPATRAWLARSADKPIEVACKLVKKWGFRDK